MLFRSEEASCPNVGECFGRGTATFMIMGDKCTRRCPFCDVGHGRPDPLDAQEPINLARAIGQMRLKYVVITSVDRDDLRDGGSQHYVDCIRAVRQASPGTRIEILTPDFRGRDDRALEILKSRLDDRRFFGLGSACGRHVDRMERMLERTRLLFRMAQIGRAHV